MQNFHVHLTIEQNAKTNSSFGATIKRIDINKPPWENNKKIPILNSAYYDFIGNWSPYGLPKLYAALTYFTGQNDNWYDDYKGSYSFTFELIIEKNLVFSKYCYHVFHYRSYIDFDLYQILPNTDPRDERVFTNPDDNLFSSAEISLLTDCFYAFLLDRMKAEKYIPKPFVKYSQSNLLKFGYSDKLTDYFFKQYEDCDEFDKEKLIISV